MDLRERRLAGGLELDGFGVDCGAEGQGECCGKSEFVHDDSLVQMTRQARTGWSEKHTKSL
jgi:hypothetical protein